jgi:hypothetical protein
MFNLIVHEELSPKVELSAKRPLHVSRRLLQKLLELRRRHGLLGLVFCQLLNILLCVGLLLDNLFFKIPFGFNYTCGHRSSAVLGPAPAASALAASIHHVLEPVVKIIRIVFVLLSNLAQLLWVDQLALDFTGVSLCFAFRHNLNLNDE